MGFGHLERCGDLAEEDIVRAASSRAECGALLARMAEVSAPATGAAASLSVFAVLASTACDWLDGDLVVELYEEEDVTVARVMTELGDGMRERVLPPVKFKAPLAEWAAAIDRNPDIVGGLTVQKVSWRRMQLRAAEVVRRSTLPPKIQISDASIWIADARAAAAALKPPLSPTEPPPKSDDIDRGWGDPSESS
jgi:hypothetical protein